MRAFVVRPFAVQGGIDFERVHRELVAPALDRLGIDGGTTEQFVDAGNIRVDMFQQLITADVVVVDVSIHNANVFYELGIRHALRARATVLLRATGASEQFPFNVQGERYLSYDPAAPAGAVDRLADALRQTLAHGGTDSPVQLLVPALGAVDPARILGVPPDFADDVHRARAAREGGDLALLSAEVRGLPWEREGLRAVGKAQGAVEAWAAAAETWEALRALGGEDLDANLRLGTLYHRMGGAENEVKGELALRRVIDDPRVEGKDRAEALALLARNVKDRWRATWEAAAEPERRAAALGSPGLLEAADGYRAAFEADLNHYYSGVNALALYEVLCELGEALPEVWSAAYEAADPPLALAQARARRDVLAKAVRLSVEAARARVVRGKPDPWVEPTAADLRCLTEQAPEPVAAQYRKALQGAAAFDLGAAARQLELFVGLGVLPATAPHALEEVRRLLPPPAATAERPRRILAFTGHRVDAPGRARRRFPPGEAAEQAARARIRQLVECEAAGGAVVGVAGGASGGDILFHEVCAELKVPTRLLLALPPPAYAAESVEPSGPGWVRRFWDLAQRLPTRVLSDRKELPGWLAPKRGYDIWQRNNLWTLHHALAAGPGNATLLALWDREPTGDSPGGTAHMVSEASSRGARVEIIDARELFRG
jgi:hypothetical protein